MATGAGAGAPADHAALLGALRRTMELAVDRLNEERERSPCLEEDGGAMAAPARRRVLLDVLMACWGMATWLGVNGIYIQLPLLVQRLPEGWALPSYIAVVIQLANVGVVLYVLLRRLFPRAPDSLYIYVLLVVATLALFLNGFLYAETAMVTGTERSVSFLVITFFTGFVGCTSSVLFYPYLRNFRDVYLATYLVGEGLSGLLPSVLSLLQGTGGETRCEYAPDNKTVVEITPEPRFDTTAFMAVLGCLSALSLLSFALLHNLASLATERVRPAEAAKEDEADTSGESLLGARWLTVMGLMFGLNALMNGVLTSVQSYSCMPYGAQTYHLAVTLCVMSNPVACLAGVWLRPLPGKVLGGMLGAGLLPLVYLLVTAALSPTPPLHTQTSGRVLIVATWVCVYALISYARMWVYGWARRGGAGGMRACGVVTQLGSATGSLLLYFLVNYTDLFVQAERCPLPPL